MQSAKPESGRERKALMERFAWLAAVRLAAVQDPMGAAELALGLSED